MSEISKIGGIQPGTSDAVVALYYALHLPTSLRSLVSLNHLKGLRMILLHYVVQLSSLSLASF